MAETQAIDTRKLEQEIAPLLQEAQSLEIRTSQDRVGAMHYLRDNKVSQGNVSKFFHKMKTLAYESWKEVCNNESRFLTPLKQGEQIIKEKILAFDQELEKQRQAEQARLQAEEDARAERERQAILKKSDQVKTPEKKEFYRQQAAEVAPNVVTVASPVEKQKGESKRTSWEATLTNMKELASAAANGNDVALSFLEFNESAAKKFAAATAGNVSVPGVAFEKSSTLSVRV